LSSTGGAGSGGFDDVTYGPGGSGGGGAGVGGVGGASGLGGLGGAGAVGANAGPSKMQFEAVGDNSDTDDDLDDNDVERKNNDISPWVGRTANGLLLPVSLPSIRNVPIPVLPVNRVDEVMASAVAPMAIKGYESNGVKKEGDIDGNLGENSGDDSDDVVRRKRRTKSSGKDEPLEVPFEDANATTEAKPYYPDIGMPLDPLRFPARSPARHLLASEGAPAFLQLPGLLPMIENPSAWKKQGPVTAANVAGGSGGPAARKSAAEAISSAAERMRGLGTDLRLVGVPGRVDTMGKMRIYKSGRVELVFNDGTIYDCVTGAPVETAQQLVAVNLGGNEDDDKTCDEISNAVTSRLVARPSLKSLVTTARTVTKDADVLVNL
jgi:hypothetical protein